VKWHGAYACDAMQSGGTVLTLQDCPIPPPSIHPPY